MIYALRTASRRGPRALKRRLNLATRDDIDRLDKRITESTQRLEKRIESRIAERFSETIKWVVGMGVAQTGFIIGVLKLHS
jgi:hypothetical protein